MKEFYRKIVIIGLIVLSVFSLSAGNLTISNVNAEETDSANIALIAIPSTSYVSSWEDLGAVNDGFTPAHSNDKTHTAYGNWNNPNSFQWVQYEWSKEYIAKSVEIYWFHDGGGVLTPTEAYIQTYDKDALNWVDLVDVPVNKDQFNYVSLGDLTTDKLRVRMLNSTQSTGILEFRVWGTTLSGSIDISAPTIPDSVVITDMSTSSFTVTWEASEDNDKVSGYNVLINDSVYATTQDLTYTLTDLEPNSHFMVAVQSFDPGDNRSLPSDGKWVFLGDSENAAKAYNWPQYSPNINYSFNEEYPNFEMPTKVLEDCSTIAGRQSLDWWTFVWGPKANSLVTESAITPMLEYFNEEFGYIRDVMGWPPDKRARRGYKSSIYLYGSGLCTDNADSTDGGGWQSATYFEGESWPIVLASYYPVYSFDPACTFSDKGFQTGAMIHEGIHALLAGLAGAKKAGWFQEGGNTWLQQEMNARRSGIYGDMGFLNAGAVIAPFMPIECYSGWLQDGTFGGPDAEGVNVYNGGTKLVTWRNLLGGHQYGNLFPVFLGNTLGPGSVSWIWQNCPERVLEGMAGGLGDMQIRRLIMEYRAKQALVDNGNWSASTKKLLDNNFNNDIRPDSSPIWYQCPTWKATPYVKTWMQDVENRILTPEPRTTPGWSGANQIPLKVFGDEVVVNFMPLGRNMTCQLCYRATDGTPVYSYPVSEGECRLKLEKQPANGVVIAVICNTDYVYTGEETRKAHFDYRLQLVEGISDKASVYRKWYDYNSVIEDVTDPAEPFPTEGATIYDAVTAVNTIDKSEVTSSVYPNPLSNREILNVQFDNMSGEKEIKILDIKGTTLYIQKGIKSQDFRIPIESRLRSGIYFVIVQDEKTSETHKIVIR